VILTYIFTGFINGYVSSSYYLYMLGINYFH
jgi:hypothetical protein